MLRSVRHCRVRPRGFSLDHAPPSSAGHRGLLAGRNAGDRIRGVSQAGTGKAVRRTQGLRRRGPPLARRGGGLGGRETARGLRSGMGRVAARGARGGRRLDRAAPRSRGVGAGLVARRREPEGRIARHVDGEDPARGGGVLLEPVGPAHRNHAQAQGLVGRQLSRPARRDHPARGAAVPPHGRGALRRLGARAARFLRG